MRTKRKNYSKEAGLKAEKRYIPFNNSFFGWKFLPYIIPGAYFIIMGFITMTNRPIGSYSVETDLYWTYIPQAKEVLNGHLVIDQVKGPMYQIILAGFGFFLNNDFFAAGKFINILFASISLFFIFKLIASIFDEKAAVLTTLFCSINFNFLQNTYEPGTDMIFIAFYSSSIFFILKDNKLNYRNYFIAGILSGMAYLTRYTGISLFFAVIIIFVFELIRNYKTAGKPDFKFMLKPLLYYFMPVVLIVTLWGLICYNATGIFFYNMNFLNTAFAVYKTDDISPDNWTLNYQVTFNSYYDVIFRNFGTFFYKIFILNFAQYFINNLSQLTPLYFGILVAIGFILFIIKFKKHNLHQKYFSLFSLIFYIQILFVFYSERFSLPLLPFYCFLVVKLFRYDFLQKYNYKIVGLRLFSLLISSLLLINFAISCSELSDDINFVPAEIITVSNLARSKKENMEGKLLMARKPHLAYYLGMNFEVTPFAKNYDEYYANIKKENADYVYISEWEALMIEPALRKMLLDYKNPPPGLEIITQTYNPVAILYKVRK